MNDYKYLPGTHKLGFPWLQCNLQFRHFPSQDLEVTFMDDYNVQWLLLGYCASKTGWLYTPTNLVSPLLKNSRIAHGMLWNLLLNRNTYTILQTCWVSCLVSFKWVPPVPGIAYCGHVSLIIQLKPLSLPMVKQSGCCNHPPLAIKDYLCLIS